MSAPNITRWMGIGLLGLPLYGVLTFFSSLNPQPDPNTHYDAWARFVTTDSFLLTHLFLSDLGLILAIFGTFALGAYLATSRAGRMGLVAMAITVFATALFLTVGGVATFSQPEQGQMHLQGIDGYREMPTILAANGESIFSPTITQRLTEYFATPGGEPKTSSVQASEESAYRTSETTPSTRLGE
jgi:hypothetical protein